VESLKISCSCVEIELISLGIVLGASLDCASAKLKSRKMQAVKIFGAIQL
jgi:hypothetical protein